MAFVITVHGTQSLTVCQ